MTTIDTDKRREDRNYFNYQAFTLATLTVKLVAGVAATAIVTKHASDLIANILWTRSDV